MNLTKGPWKVNERLAGVVENQYGEIIATMGGSVDGSPADNARLISAAPDMLEALKEIEVVFRHYRGADLRKDMPAIYANLNSFINMGGA